MDMLDAGIGFAAALDVTDELSALLQPDTPRYTIVAVTRAYASCMRGPHADLVGQGIVECLSKTAWPAARKNQTDIIASLDRVRASGHMERIDLEAANFHPHSSSSSLDGRRPGAWVVVHTPFLLPNGQVAYICQSMKYFSFPDHAGCRPVASAGTFSSQTRKNMEITENIIRHMKQMQEAARGLGQAVRGMRGAIAKPHHDSPNLLGLLAAAENRERQAIARDLHDDLGQTLTAARIKLAAFRKPGSKVSKECALAEIDELIAAAERATRSLATQLMPPVLYELGLVPALRWLFEELLRRYGLQVEFSDDDAAKPLSQDARAILYRCVRELLINVAKHAQVQEALVGCFVRKGHLVISVCDEGVGFDAKRSDLAGQHGNPKLGLASIAERLSYLGGTFNMVSHPGKGTEATLVAPLNLKIQARSGA